MDSNPYTNEFDANGRLSYRATLQLKQEIASGTDAAEAISLATDFALFEVVDAIQERFKDRDAMVRWTAIESVLVRFRQPRRIFDVIDIAKRDESLMVRGIALSGLGEVFLRIDDEFQRREIATILVSVVYCDDVPVSLRAAAYDGILAANDVLPTDRPSPAKEFEPNQDIDHALVKRFRSAYLISETGTGKADMGE